MSSTPNTPPPSPSNIHPLASKVKASNNHSYWFNWISIQGCKDLQKIVCNNSCRSLLPPPSPHFCGLLLKGTCFKPRRVWKCMEIWKVWFENTQCCVSRGCFCCYFFYVLFKFNAFIYMKIWMLAKVTIFITVCIFAFLSNRQWTHKF